MKNIFSLSLLLLITFVNANAQEMNAENVVQKNLEYYNKRDIDGFMSLIDNDIEIYNFADNEITVRGYDECKSVYEDLFNESPKLHSKILKRIVFDNKVIDHEYITGRRGVNQPLELVLIYEVKNDKIFKITVLRK